MTTVDATTGFAGDAVMGSADGNHVATLCGDPVCPPLPGEDASADGSSDAAPSDAAVSDTDAASDAADAGDAGPDGG